MLDGADTGLMHFINETNREKLQGGLRVEPVFKEERAGYITDIEEFRIIKNRDEGG